MPPQHLSLATLHQQSTARLRQAWTEVMGSAPGYTGSRELLLLGLAWHLQAQQEGGLTPTLTRQLNHLSKASRANGSGKSRTPSPRLQLGTVLTKDWRGKRYMVMVQKDGLAFEGHTYQSLSQIARRITGTRWNGPAFFGIRSEPTRQTSREPPS